MHGTELAKRPVSESHSEKSQESEESQQSGAPRAEGARPASRRLLWTAVLALLLGAGMLWLSAQQTWFATQRELPVRGTVPHTENGADYAPALLPLAVLAAAAVAGLVASSGWPRRVLGVLVALAGAGAVWVGLDGVAPAFHDHPGDYPRGEILLGRGLATLGGLLVFFAGLVVANWGARMPRLGGSYQAPAAARRNRDPDKEMWQALSEGEDPTSRD
ncbi:MAG: hypothetical protein GEU98_00445 [Pseudonocardiaceae bacterium]|nr:hypothetical protein [Pseudonocardiaceae bacterium]